MRNSSHYSVVVDVVGPPRFIPHVLGELPCGGLTAESLNRNYLGLQGA